MKGLKFKGTKDYSVRAENSMWVTQMAQRLDLTDLKILDGLARYGPRNVTEAARKLGMHPETMRKKLKRLTSQFFLRINVNIYHTYLGLKKAVVFAEATPGYEESLFNALKMNDYWMFVSRCYGTFEGCTGIFTIPKDHVVEFKQFLEEVRRSEVARNLDVYWSTCFQSVNSKRNWYDPKSQTWDFCWDKWIEEIEKEEAQLPYTLVDPENFPIKGDETDIFILKELEKDGTITFTKLGEKLGLSPQLVGYHYHNHLIEQGLIEGFDVTVFHFGRANSEFFFFIFKFHNGEKLAKFASSLLDKPFVWAVGKILGEKSLYGYLCLPKSEFRKFLKTLSRLVREGLLESYRYAIQDFQASSRQTISYEYFEDGRWIYDHDKHIKNLRESVEQILSRNKLEMLAKS